MTERKEQVNHPSHYNNYSVEVLEMMRRIYGDEKVAIFCELNAFKYRMRMGTKDDNDIKQDFDKEQFYLNYKKKLDSSKDPYYDMSSTSSTEDENNWLKRQSTSTSTFSKSSALYD